MNICFQLLLYITVATPQEKIQFKEYWRYQRKQFIERHIIADDPDDELTKKIREEEGTNDDKRND